LEELWQTGAPWKTWETPRAPAGVAAT
jgi:hypothetical protein